MPLSPDLRHRLLLAAGVTERGLARQLHEHPDRPIQAMSLQDLVDEEQQLKDAGQ